MRDCRWRDCSWDPFIKVWMDTHANRIPLPAKQEAAVSKLCYWGSQHGNTLGRHTETLSAFQSSLNGPQSRLVAWSAPNPTLCYFLPFAGEGRRCKEEMQETGATCNETFGHLTVKCSGFKLIAFLSSQIQRVQAPFQVCTLAQLIFVQERPRMLSSVWHPWMWGRGGRAQGRAWGIWPCPKTCGVHVLAKSGTGRERILEEDYIEEGARRARASQVALGS